MKVILRVSDVSAVITVSNLPRFMAQLWQHRIGQRG